MNFFFLFFSTEVLSGAAPLVGLALFCINVLDASLDVDCPVISCLDLLLSPS